MSPRDVAVAVSMLALLPVASGAGEKEIARLQACRDVVEQMVTVREGIPRTLLDKSRCLAVVPGVKKAAFVAGGQIGWGAVLCRTEGGEGPWSAPLLVSLKGGSIGFQIGGESADLVLLLMDAEGIDHLLRSKFTLGADASVAAGPLGRKAQAATDATMHAEILSYSRSRGVFAGISLEGASLAPDQKGNQAIYHDRIPIHELLFKSGQDLPVSAQGLVSALDRLAPRRKG